MQTTLPRVMRAVVPTGHRGLDRRSVREERRLRAIHRRLARIRRIALRRQAVLFTALAIAFAPLIVVAAETSLRERLSAASPERGRQVLRVCSACHSVEAGAAHKIGPNLWGVVGRPVATAEGYDRYSPAMVSFAGAWSPERLDRYLRRPTTVVEGTAMVFAGVPDDGDRADLIAWLALNSPDPTGFASKHAAIEGAAGAGEGAAGAGAGNAQPTEPQALRPTALGVLVAAEGADETHAYCTACHSERIVAQQGLTRTDWEELLEQMVEENGMDPIEEPDRGRILAYLETHYGPDRPNFPRPLAQ